MDGIKLNYLLTEIEVFSVYFLQSLIHWYFILMKTS
jgi:hypothetical protein